MIPDFSRVVQTMIYQIVAALPSIFVSIVIFLLFWLAAKLIYSFLNKLGKTNHINRQPVFHLIALTSKYSILIVGIITALGSAGVNVSALVASVGLSGLAVSFAAKDSISNVFAGVLLLLYHPFIIGDTITVGDVKGKVKKINLRYVYLETEDSKILIPNASFLTQNIVISHTQ